MKRKTETVGACTYDEIPRFVVAGLLVSGVTGLVSGVAPARRATALDPIEARRAE